MKRVRQWLEFAAVWLVLKCFGALPRGVARSLGAAIARLLFALRPPLRKAAECNLQLAFPEWNAARRGGVSRAMVRQLGWMLAEFSRFPKYARAPIESIVALEGEENYAAAERRGKGVLFLTGHIGAWELAPFAQARYGHPLHFLARAVDNPRVDALVNGYRELAGNVPIEKNSAAREMLRVLKSGGAVGVLADQNTLPSEGVFVDFFGVPACTTSGLARVAVHTGAAVVPGYVVWDREKSKYVLRFEPEVAVSRSSDLEADVRENTARFTRVLESVIRRYPGQWVWVHKRWKTRPPGEPPLYQ